MLWRPLTVRVMANANAMLWRTLTARVAVFAERLFISDQNLLVCERFWFQLFNNDINGTTLLFQ